MVIVIEGNPIDGMTFVGPFGSHEEAIIFMEGEGGDWWIANMETPPEGLSTLQVGKAEWTA